MKLRHYVLSLVLLSIALLTVAVPVAADLKDVPVNGTVLLGEEGLDVSTAVGSATYLAWWDSTSTLANPPDRIIDLDGFVLTNYNIDDSPSSIFFCTDGKGFWWRLYSSGQVN
ncbi:MAG: DUF3821 domain-containing protein, partial [Methanolinea sp.]|nr:DUF3821 domain-containing protein [Methanolinea sp.]